jgi:tRNA U54 and U55 pseudouridine synthase Pus10
MTAPPPDDRSEHTKAEDEKAAIEQVEPDRLLAGEDENSQHLDDAEHWIKVYRELLEFKRSVLATTEEHIGTMEPDASAEVQKTDLKALHAEALRFERRLVYWRSRMTALQDQAGGAAG